MYSEITSKDKSILNERGFIIQGKSSCIPVQMLLKNKSKLVKFDILDACSAPGNKTIQLSDLSPDGKIIAVEKDIHRFKVLQ